MHSLFFVAHLGGGCMKLLTDQNRTPIPQYKNPETGNFEAIEGKYGANSFLQKGTVAEEAWEGNSDIVKTFPSDRYGFSVVNDGTEDLLFEINNQTRRVKPGEAYNGLFNAFTQVVIISNSSYRAEVLS